MLPGIAPIMGSDLPRRPLRAHLSARLFGGASGGVFRGMATLALGSGIGRVIGIAAIPVLTRLYTPEDFGALAVFTALVAILAPLVTLRYVLALPLPRHDGVAMNLLVLSFGLMLVFCALIALALGLWGGALLTLVSMQVLAPWWWLIALGVLGTATYEMLTMWATRKRAYKVIAQTNVTQSAAGAVVKIGLGLAAWAPLGLLVGQVVAQTGGIGRLITGFGADLRAQWHHLRASRIRKAAWRHRGFPIWRVPSQFLMVLSMQAPIFVMAVLFDPESTGQLAIALSVLTVPTVLIGQTAAKAFYAEATLIGAHNPTKIKEINTAVERRLAFMILLPCLVLVFWSDLIFQFLFGQDWKLAGIFAGYLAPTLFFRFLQSTTTYIYTIFEKHIFPVILNALGLIMVAVFSIVCWVFGVGPEAYVMGISVATTLSMLANFSAARIILFAAIKKAERGK